MPLNTPAVQLAAEPRSVSEARRWAVTSLQDLGRDDLVECARLGVSELVTNALLHGEPAYALRLRGTTAFPRIEVLDASPVIPMVADPSAGASALRNPIRTTGRGLALVSLASRAWGASLEPTGGKVVWFEPADDLASEPRCNGILDFGDDPSTLESTKAGKTASLLLANIDLKLLAAVRSHSLDLNRELRLLALSHPDEYPHAVEFTELFRRYVASFPPGMGAQLSELVESGLTHLDVTVAVRPDDTALYSRLLELFADTDRFCREQQLLTLARTPEQIALQTWYLREGIRQLAGGEPRRWDPADWHLPAQREPHCDA